MSDLRRLSQKSTKSAISNLKKQKKGRTSQVIDLVNENVNPKQLNKTPVYTHNQINQSSTSRVLSDFVYIPSSTNKSIKNSVRSDTTYNQLVKTHLKRNVSEPKSLRSQSTDPKSFNRKLVSGEKDFHKKKATPAYSQLSDNNHVHKNGSTNFDSYKEAMHGKIVKPDISKYIITPEQKKKIESTLPPGETVIVPRILSTVHDRYGNIPNLLVKSGKGSVFTKSVVRKCLCKFMTSDVDDKQKFLPKRNEDDRNDVIAKPKSTPKRKGSKSSDVRNDASSKVKPLPKRNTSVTNGENYVNDKKLLPKKNGSKSSNEKVTDSKGKKDPIKHKTKEDGGKSKIKADSESKEKEDPFKLKWRKIAKRSKKLVNRLPEKKVDENVPYHPLISHSTRRINRSQYQKHFHLRIRGPSLLIDLSFNPLQVYNLGERGSGFRSKGDVQDFYELRDELLESGRLFEDPEFPAVDTSIFYSQRVGRGFEWRRPHEICDNPQLFVEGYSRFDVQQGELGDCWLLAAVANLTLYRRLFFQVVPDDQGFDEKYAGIFHFRFWQYGRWIDVVIDDRLPTYNGQLVFLHSTEENEFWSALLEKAYAKLHGSYESLKGGSTCEAMEDFTGGVTEMYEMNASPPNLFKIVLKAFERSSLMGCSLEPDPNVLEAETREGLIRGHAYSITRVKFVDIQTPNTSGKIPLVRLRNPWGNESEWNGPWGDKSPEWRFIPEHEKEELGLTFDDDGEFWMSFKDFQTHFDRLEICNLNPDSLTEEELQDGNKKRWEVSFFEGEWVRGVTAGGCRNYLETFCHNPQYRITLTEVDDEDDEGKCTLIVALMQKNRRSQRNMGIDVLTIGFAIYYLPSPDRAPKPLDLNFFKYNSSVARSPSFINLREVSCRFKLPPGTYCIVPSTFEPNEEGEFLLRIFSEHQNHLEENDEDIAYGEVDQRMRKLILASLNAPNITLKHTSRDKTIKNIEPTPQETHQNDQVYQFFLKLAGDDGEVDWMELKQILDYAMRNEMRNKEFSKDVCRSMVAMLDSDRSGKLGYEEFKSLWSDIRDWKNAFRLYDRDNSGTLDGFELRQALNSAGYHLNYHILNILMHRYGNKQGQLEFDDFIMCAVKLKTMINIFKAKDPNGANTANFSMEEWIANTLYA